MCYCRSPMLKYQQLFSLEYSSLKSYTVNCWKMAKHSKTHLGEKLEYRGHVKKGESSLPAVPSSDKTTITVAKAT